MGFLSKFFNKEKENKSISSVMSSCEVNRPSLGDTYTDSKSTAQYRSWVYTAANLNSNTVASAKLKLFSTKAPKVSKSRKLTKKDYQFLKNYRTKSLHNGTEILNHPILEFLDAPNSHDTTYSMMKKIDLFLELTGDAYVYVQRDSRGIPFEMDVLYSQFVNIQTDGSGNIISYNYGQTLNGKYQYTFQPDEIIHIKFFDPNCQWYGISPLQASFRSVALIDSATLFEEALNRNMGVPTGIIKYKGGNLTEDQARTVESKWQRKFASSGRAGKVLVTGHDIDYENIGITPKDMQFEAGRKYCREDILSCFGIPQALLLTESVNRSNMVQSEIIYYKQTILPRHILIAQALTKGLFQGTVAEGKIFLAFEDTSPEDIELLFKKADILSSTGSITKNELRAMLRLEPADNMDTIIGGPDEKQI